MLGAHERLLQRGRIASGLKGSDQGHGGLDHRLYLGGVGSVGSGDQGCSVGAESRDRSTHRVDALELDQAREVVASLGEGSGAAGPNGVTGQIGGHNNQTGADGYIGSNGACLNGNSLP